MSPQLSDGLIAILIISCALIFYGTLSVRRIRKGSFGCQPGEQRFAKPLSVDDFEQPYSVYDRSFDRQVDAATLATDSGAAIAQAYLETRLLDLPTLPPESIERLRATLCATGSPTTIVTLLVDNSGSMRKAREEDGLAAPDSNIALAASAASALCATLEDLGTPTEVLGFTTSSWRGGEARKSWIRNGRPPYPGRLCDLMHIVYKSADDMGPGGRRYLGVMLQNSLLKENVDGEALLWARDRLLQRPETRRVLIVVSDGAPVDDSSLMENGPTFLERHIREVITEIESDPAISLGAVGIRHDVDRYYSCSVTVDDGADLVSEVLNLLADILEGKPKTFEQSKPPLS